MAFLIECNNKSYVLSSAHEALKTTVNNPMPKWLCVVQNVNGTLNKLIYKLRLIGVDATADVAVFEMINEDQIVFPRLGQHPTIVLGDKRGIPIGKNIKYL